MKKFKLLSVLLVMFSVLGLISCDSEPVDPVLNENINNPENPENPENPGNTGVFKVDFSGQTYIAESATAKYEMGMITIVGTKSSGGSFSLSLDGVTEGTYSNTTMGYYPGINVQTAYINLNPQTFSKNGTIVITEVDYENNTVSGTFTFTGHSAIPGANPGSMVFTNGIFENVPVTDLPEPGTVNEMYMRANVDGELFNFGLAEGLANPGVLVLSGDNIASHENLSVYLPENVTPGTYSLEIFTDYYATYADLSGLTINSDSGTVTIISHADGWIKGTFSFSGEDFDGNQHSVTNGEFNIHY
jgi:hypothetical protein